MCHYEMLTLFLSDSKTKHTQHNKKHFIFAAVVHTLANRIEHKFKTHTHTNFHHKILFLSRSISVIVVIAALGYKPDAGWEKEVCLTTFR